jgi:type I restriction enzyme M protein
MLDTDTKRRIDTARDILVGKVPDHKSQVERVTNFRVGPPSLVDI